MKLYSRLSLSSRLTLLALLALVPLVALLVVQHVRDRDNREDTALAEASAYTQRASTSLEQFAVDVDSFTAAAVLTLGQQETISYPVSRGYLQSLTGRYKNLNTIFITDPNGIVIAGASDSDNTGFNVSDRPYIKALQSGQETVWTGAINGVQTGQVLGTFGRVIHGQDGAVRAFMIVVFQPTDIVAALGPDFPKDANFLLVDNNGRLVVSAREPDPKLRDVSASPFVQKALAGQFATLSGQKTPFDEGKRYGAYAPIPHMGWVVGYTRSSSLLAADARSELLRNLGILALIMAAVVAAMLLVARQMTRPLKALATAAHQLSEGRAVSIPTDPHADPDVRKLQQAFILMGAAVQGRERMLQDEAEALSHLESAGAHIAAGLDFEKTVQAVLDAGRELTGAEYGAFFSKVTEEEGEAYRLHLLSTAGKEALPDAGNATDNAIFASTLMGGGPLRIDDVTQDARYARSAAAFGLPPGDPPVRSYLAVPVVSSEGGVLGGLFFAHSKPAMFTARHASLASRIAAWAGIALDNSRLYVQAKHIQEELRRANVAKDEFLGLISHELRTPVTTIYGGLRILSMHRDVLQSEQAEDLISSMAEEGIRLVKLIEDLLALTRVELGKEMDRSVLVASDLVAETVETFSRQRPSRQVILSLEEDCPPIEVEPTYFKQILSNLLSNADKYSSPDEPIEAVTNCNGESVSVIVNDHGPGVDAADIERIFDSFYRSEKTSTMAPGQGLGLTVCRKLVEAQGGWIWAENIPQGGFRVGFSFPAFQLPEQEQVEQSEPEATTEAIS